LGPFLILLMTVIGTLIRPQADTFEVYIFLPQSGHYGNLPSLVGLPHNSSVI
jgi:hypothetical protein